MDQIQCIICRSEIRRGSKAWLELHGWRWLPWMVTMVGAFGKTWQHAWFCPECAEKQTKSLQERND